MLTQNKRVSLGIPTYNSTERAYELLMSIFTFTDPKDLENVKMVVLDDGTPNLEVRKELRGKIESIGSVDFIQHEKNEGIPKSWNDLTNHFDDTDYMVLLNDDVRVCNLHWLKTAMYFLHCNEKVAVVGWPLIQVNPETGMPFDEYCEKTWGEKPGKVGAPVGCAFAFKKELFDKITNSDSSVGFWQDLKSFHEETMFGFKMYEMGYSNWMLPHYPFEHLHSRTFAENPELTWMEFNPKYGTKEEFLATIEKSKVVDEHYKIILRESLKKNRVDRMSFTRWVFARYWKVEDSYDMPQVPVHKKLVDPCPKQSIKWLDKDLKEKEEVI